MRVAARSRHAGSAVSCGSAIDAGPVAAREVASDHQEDPSPGVHDGIVHYRVLQPLVDWCVVICGVFLVGEISGRRCGMERLGGGESVCLRKGWLASDHH